MSRSMPGAPGVPVVRRSMALREARASPPAPGPVNREGAAPPPGSRLAELAAALGALQTATGLKATDFAARLLEPLDPASPLRLVDVFADGRADLVTAYLKGDLELPALLEAWQPAGG